jgi:streptogrisin C
MISRMRLVRACSLLAPPLDLVRTELTSSPISAMADLHGGSSYKNTNPLESPECSLGFAVEQGGFLTAAHCGLAGDSVTTNSSPVQALGIFSASTRPVQIEWDPDGIFVYDNDDQAWISISPPWVPSYKVAPSLYNQPDIMGASKPMVGQWLCRFGGRTGGPHCGEVLSTSVRLTLGIFDGYPLTIPDAIQANICADRGDSGGPLLRPSWMKVLPGRSYAVGLLSGGTLPAGCPNTSQITYYSKVGRALVNFGLTLKTLESSP